MAFGIIPRETREFPLSGISDPDFIPAAYDVAQNLGWSVEAASADRLVAFTPFRSRFRNERVTIRLQNGFVSVESETIGGQFLDHGKNQINIETFLREYDHWRNADPQTLAARVAGIREQMASVPLADADLSDAASKSHWYSFLVPVRGFAVTPVLIDLNVFIFLVMAISALSVFSFSSELLIGFGANFRLFVLNGEWWRLVTAMFLHAGILHLLLNMYALLYIGVLLEPRLGSVKFAFAYLVTGIVASLASIYHNEAVVSVGASGAIFGLYGVFFAMLLTNQVEKAIRKPLLLSIGLFVTMNLANGMKAGIDAAAHIGGLVSGLIMGFALYGESLLPRRPWRKVVSAGAAVALIGLSAWACARLPFEKITGGSTAYMKAEKHRMAQAQDVETYGREMKKFQSREAQALEVLKWHAPIDTPKVVDEIESRSLYYWQLDKQMVSDLDTLDLPATLHEQNRDLIRYCDLRYATFQLLLKKMKEGSSSYDEAIQQDLLTTDSVMKSIKRRSDTLAK